MKLIPSVLVTGGAGYVGAVLVPKLLAAGYRVRVLDLYIFGDHALDSVRFHPDLTQIRGDIRDRMLLEHAVAGCDAIIHLAGVSNDPSFELDPALARTINYDAFGGLLDAAENSSVRRFVFASSSSVYGVKTEESVTEDLSLSPLTDYSRYKALCEEMLLTRRRKGFAPLILRPATLCGYSPRQRLDLVVNALTNDAVNRGRITIQGGSQARPNLHIQDMADCYLAALQWPDELIDGRVFNVGGDNHTVAELAQMVRDRINPSIPIQVEPMNDVRSYRVASDKIKRALGWEPRRSVMDAIDDLVAAFRHGLIPDPMHDSRYYNVRRMSELDLHWSVP